MNSRLNRAYLTTHPHKPSDLDTIVEESCYTKTQALSNSQKFSSDMENSMKISNLAYSMNIQNGSMILPKTTKMEISENHSPRNKSGIFISSPRQRANSPEYMNTDIQIITINNRKFVTSKSPSKKNQAEEARIIPLKPVNKTTEFLHQIPSKLHSHIVQSSSPNKKLTVESKKYTTIPQQQTQLIKKYEQKISNLTKKLQEMQEQKKYSIVNLLKERLELKSILEKAQKQKNQLKEMLVIKQQIIEKLHERIKELQSDVQNFESNEKYTTKKLLQIEMDEDISKLRQQNEALMNQIERFKKEEYRLQHNVEVLNSPYEIDLPNNYEEGSQVSMVIGANWQNLLHNVMGVQNINSQYSREEVKEDTEQYHIDEIIANIQELTNKNRELMKKNSELQNLNEQLHKKIEQLSEKIVQQEGQLELRDIIAKQTATVLKNISAVVVKQCSKNQQPQDAEKSMKQIQDILEQVKQEEEEAEQETIIGAFLNSYV